MVVGVVVGVSVNYFRLSGGQAGQPWRFLSSKIFFQRTTSSVYSDQCGTLFHINVRFTWYIFQG